MKRALFGLVPGAAICLALGAGCGDSDPEDPASGGGSGGGTTSSMMTTTSSTSSNTGSTTTGLPTECDPLALMSGQSLDATCGIFVNPAGPSGDGSQAMPYATLAEALTNNPDNQPIYVCATSDSLDEPVTLTGTERLVGGLDCATWQASATKTAWTSEQNTIPLTLSSTSGAHVQGFAITARDAMGFDAGTLDGNDSIAIVADGATATLLQVDVVAGAGGVGGDGEDQMGQAPGRQSDAASFDGNVGGGCGMGGGSSKTYSLCPGGSTTTGGKGGDGDIGAGSAGLAGTPALGGGVPGAGDSGAVGWDCAANMGLGAPGFGGAVGGAGAAGATAGTLELSGFVGMPAGSGMAGGIGQGGGGGGGRKGNNNNGCGADIAGPSGGSGGAGGCGGLAGGGAGQGGASVALISLTSTLVLTDVTLRAGAGGSGGAGGDGQLGGNGGNGANGGGNACSGGDGGAGGQGGPGGGGAGGASIGIAYTGAAPDISDDAITVAAAAAAGGAGGNANTAGNSGAAGLTSKKQSF